MESNPEDLVQETPVSSNGRAEDVVQKTLASSNVRQKHGIEIEKWSKLKKKCYPKDALKEDVIQNKPAWADKLQYDELVDYLSTTKECVRRH
nr:hypothetical protein CFP56_08256 [Quercus suber]